MPSQRCCRNGSRPTGWLCHDGIGVRVVLASLGHDIHHMIVQLAVLPWLAMEPQTQVLPDSKPCIQKGEGDARSSFNDFLQDAIHALNILLVCRPARSNQTDEVVQRVLALAGLSALLKILVEDMFDIDGNWVGLSRYLEQLAAQLSPVFTWYLGRSLREHQDLCGEAPQLAKNPDFVIAEGPDYEGKGGMPADAAVVLGDIGPD